MKHEITTTEQKREVLLNQLKALDKEFMGTYYRGTSFDEIIYSLLDKKDEGWLYGIYSLTETVNHLATFLTIPEVSILFKEHTDNNEETADDLRRLLRFFSDLKEEQNRFRSMDIQIGKLDGDNIENLYNRIQAEIQLEKTIREGFEKKIQEKNNADFRPLQPLPGSN